MSRNVWGPTQGHQGPSFRPSSQLSACPVFCSPHFRRLGSYGGTEHLLRFFEEKRGVAPEDYPLASLSIPVGPLSQVIKRKKSTLISALPVIPHPPIFLSVHPYVHLSIHPSVHLSTHPPISVTHLPKPGTPSDIANLQPSIVLSEISHKTQKGHKNLFLNQNECSFLFCFNLGFDVLGSVWLLRMSFVDDNVCTHLQE